MEGSCLCVASKGPSVTYAGVIVIHRKEQRCQGERFEVKRLGVQGAQGDSRGSREVLGYKEGLSREEKNQRRECMPKRAERWVFIEVPVLAKVEGTRSGKVWKALVTARVTNNSHG